MKTLGLLLIAISAQIFAATTWAERKLTMAVAMPKESQHGKFLMQLFEDVFKHAGLNLETINCSPVQCSLYIRRGIVDGDLGRTEYFARDYPAMVQVPEPVSHLDYAAFVIDEKFQVSSLEEIVSKNARLAIRADDYLIKHKVAKLPHRNVSLTYVQHWIEGFNKLVNGEVDIYLGSMMLIRGNIKNTSYQAVKQSGVLVREPVYIYLQEKNKDLIDKLADSLKELQMEQKIERYKEKFSSPDRY